MITRQQIDKLKGDKRSNVLFIYDTNEAGKEILVALKYGNDRHWVMKPRIVEHNEHQIVIRDGNRRYVVELLFNRV